jgi:hypothetical protein
MATGTGTTSGRKTVPGLVVAKLELEGPSEALQAILNDRSLVTGVFEGMGLTVRKSRINEDLRARIAVEPQTEQKPAEEVKA